MAKVFISHSWKDNEIARKIAQYLKHDRVDIWIDYARIKPGEGLPHRISQALEWCDTLVLIWSKGAVDSYYVGLEWQAALDMQKKIILCLIDDAKRPAILRGFLYIDFKNFSTGYGQLIDALELKREQAPEQPSEPTEKIQDYSAPEKQKELKPKSEKAPTRTKTLNEKQKITKTTSLLVAILIVVFGGIYFLRSLISKNNQNEKNVATQQAAQDSLKIYWEKWQSEMNTSYQQAQQRDSNATLDASFKVQTWQDFLTKYARDNPDRRRDDSLRTKANDRKIYWRNQATQDSVKAAEKARREQLQVEMDKSYERARRQDSYTSLTAANKEKIWQDFLNKYAEDNPRDEKDNDHRSYATSRINYWHNYRPKPPKEITVKGMTLILIPGGTYDMGDTFGDGYNDEKPVHSVTVPSFYMGKTEVTVAQYRNFCQTTGREMPSAPSWGFKDSHPIVNVSWNDAVAFCQWAGCRLPTEAEWEYAAREGGKKVKWSGTSTESLLGDYAWYSSNSSSKTHPVATKKPNALGLYDMSGNVWEWCSDWYAEDYYKNSPQNNPRGSSSGTTRLLRGGYWDFNERGCRSSVRYRNDPDYRSNGIGFRVVQDSPQ